MIGKRSTATKTWATNAGHAAQTDTLARLTGKLVEVDIAISSVTGDPDVTVTIKKKDTNGATVFSSGAKNDGTNYVFSSESNQAVQDAAFDPVWLFDEDLYVSIDPDGDAGGTAQTLSVTVTVYLES
jgi:hypothetical protein